MKRNYMDGYQKKSNHLLNETEFEIQHLKQQLNIRNKLFNETVIKMHVLQKELLDLNNFNDQLFQSIQDIIIVTDNQNNIIKINSSLSNVLGFKISDLIGKQIDEFFEKSIEEINFKNIDSNYSGEFVDKSSRRLPVMISKFDFNNVNNESIGSIYIIKDMTDIKNTELELKKAHIQLKKINHELEERVRIRTKEIHHLLKQKEDFINQIGHDLKNPLGPLLNLIPMMAEMEEDQKKKEIFNVIMKNTTHMKNLVNKTVKIAELNAPETKFSYEDINIFNVVNDVVEQNKFLFQKNSLKVENNIPEDTWISGDKLQITELFDNLLNNAGKYSNGPGCITVDVKEEHGDVTFYVKDTGIGMTKDQIGHVFDEFYKADSSRHDFDSSGLGMSICKRIVEKHGGHIWVESEGLGKGSTIFLAFPKKPGLQETKIEHNSYEDISHEIDLVLKTKN